MFFLEDQSNIGITIETSNSLGLSVAKNRSNASWL